jgi:hypothetical protein
VATLGEETRLAQIALEHRRRMRAVLSDRVSFDTELAEVEAELARAEQARDVAWLEHGVSLRPGS